MALFSPDHFDQIRSRIKTIPDFKLDTGRAQVLEILQDLNNAIEKLYNQAVIAEVDIKKHDAHGRVVLEEEDASGI